MKSILKKLSSIYPSKTCLHSSVQITLLDNKCISSRIKQNFTKIIIMTFNHIINF